MNLADVDLTREVGYVNLAAIAHEGTPDDDFFQPPDYDGDQKGSQGDLTWSPEFTHPPVLPQVGASQISTQSDNIHEVSTQL